MAPKQTQETVEEVFRQVLNLPEKMDASSVLRREFSGWDSIRHMELVIRVQSAVHIRIPIDMIGKIQTLSDLQNLAQSLRP